MGCPQRMGGPKDGWSSKLECLFLPEYIPYDYFCSVKHKGVVVYYHLPQKSANYVLYVPRYSHLFVGWVILTRGWVVLSEDGWTIWGHNTGKLHK